MEELENMELDNKWNDRISSLTVLVMMFLFIQPFIVYAVTSNILAFAIVFLILTPFWFEVLFDYYKRTPTRVEVRTDGILLKFKLGSLRFVSWKEIRDMSDPPPNRNLSNVRKTVFVGLRVEKKRSPYALTKDIASTISGEYRSATGQMMPLWNGR
jgi:hypothetical protein